MYVKHEEKGDSHDGKVKKACETEENAGFT